MRILMVTKFPNHSGVTTVCNRILGSLAKAGHQVKLANIRSGASVGPAPWIVDTYLQGRWARLSTIVGLPVLRIFMPDQFPDESSPDVFSWFVSGFYGHWGRESDLVILGDENLAIFASVYPRLFGHKYAVVVHEHQIPPLRVVARLQRDALNSAQCLWTPSPALVSVWKRRVNTPIDFVFLAQPVSRPRIEKEPFFLADTRWTPFRNPQFLLEIMEFERRGRYVLAGSFSSQSLRAEFLNEVKKRGLNDRLTVKTGLSGMEVADLYSRATAFVRWPEIQMGEIHEFGIGWGVVAAMENACPIVLDRRMAAAQLLRDCEGALAVEASPEAFASALSDLLSKSRSIGKRALSVWTTATRLADEYSVPKFPILGKSEPH